MVTNPPPFTASPTTGATAVLLVVAPFEESAKRAESHLRNAGHKVRAIWTSQHSDLDQLLQKGQPDLLMAADQAAETPLKVVLDICRRFAPNLPVIALGSQLSADATTSAVAAGARDLVADSDPECLAHLERVYVRELIAYRNLRELARSRSQLADYESRYSQLIAGTGDAVAHIYEGIVSKVNPAFAALVGYDDVDLLSGMPLMDIISPDNQAGVRDYLKQLNNGRADGRPLECALLSRTRDKVPVRAQLTPGEAEGERFVEMLIRAEAAQAAATAATAASGRSEFFAALDAPAAGDGPRAAIFAVVDNFAALEDRVGYLDAEQVAVQAGAKMAALADPNDGVFRFSTQEFAILVSRPDALQFEALADRLARDIAAQVFSSADHESQVTLSVTVYPLGGSDTATQVAGDLVREARKLSAKGGNRAIVLGPTARANADEREDQRKADVIRKALEENRFKLAYQTIASLEGDTRQHFDVLVRMVNDEGVELHASDFIRSAEKAGLMRAIDRWVISRAIKVISSREPRKDASMLFLKLSEDSLRDAESFLAWFQDALKGRRFADNEICIEVQEIILQNHIRKAKVLTKAMRDFGASVAIEHFGIGANSAQLVEHLPINFLKFHSSYTHNFTDKDIQKKMSTLMEMAKQRRIKTIVSHVEDANVMARMWQMGVNYIQGYHVQEPEVVLLT
ncbi:PAS domain S-box-containing protein [Panacagrimonas perspica]|uniref:PAS domain S-box-containing protein n=1 Tax=Panacagrimonas perspica TaxID=381431 RepID=A0A4R7PG35_9GAMM|nr:EAL domain-containing protein [Panacagrimonas perspica]TDU32360.1 PAS domain S-box-containing protein [Panacagrimonas perspica]